MAEKITDTQVADLVAILRADSSIDAKVQQVNSIKSGIKQHNVPDTCVVPLCEALRTASTAQHAALVNAGFTALNHLLTRLSRQEPKFLTKEAARTLPLIVEKLGDQKEKFRSLALQAMATLYKVAPVEVERSVRNTAMTGKNPRAKEASLQWLLQMHQENGLQFRSYVPTLMELLEDADGMVRDAAKATVIELFRNAPNGAKSDLKRQLKNFKVRPAIEQAIVKELVPTGSAPSSQPDIPDEPSVPSKPNLTASTTSFSGDRPITPLLDNRPEQVEPTYVNTQRELDEIFREMHVHFDGKETEQNWLKREESMTKLRRLIAGNAVTDFQESFFASLRSLLDGIIKAVISLRTSLSKEGCSLVQDIARVYGPGMDPMVELLMQTFIKLSAATKKISSQLANITVDAIIGKVTYNARIMQHIWGACQDKNVQPRMYATGWLKTILDKEAHHKSHVEHSGGLDLIEKCLKKGLADPNPGVREKMRSTYWTFAGIWPARAEALMNGLDATAQKLLQNDPGNPNSTKASEGSARPGLGLSKSTTGATKSSVREAMLAQKKALAAKNLPARPGSAMSHFSPARTVSNSSNASSATSTATASAVRSRPESTLTSGGGLSGAPMRPARRRPEMVARPATAGPYSVRSHDQPSREQSSPPESLRPKAVTPKAITTSPKRTVPRTRPGHVATASESSIPIVPSPSKLVQKGAPSPRASPRASPATSKPVLLPHSTSSSPLKTHEDLSALVVPKAPVLESSPKSLVLSEPIPTVAIQAEDATPNAPPEAQPLKVYEDPFTEEDAATPKPTITSPVLEDKPINEDAANPQRAEDEKNGLAESPTFSHDKTKQNARLLDSGISKVRQKTLDVHGFRKLQSIIRDNKVPFPPEKFDALLQGLFDYLESSLAQLATDKAQDVKAQVLATIKLLLRKMRDSFKPHVSRSLESLLRTRAAYDSRTHIVSGLELLASDLVTLGDASEIAMALSRALATAATTIAEQPDDPAAASCARSLSMGLHIMKQLVDAPLSGGKGASNNSSSSSEPSVPSDAEMDMLTALAALAARCLEARDSGVRMDSVHLCVALHARVGDTRFWEAIRGVADDPKSLITYYIVKRQREREASAPPGSPAGIVPVAAAVLPAA